jgi:hypothetical protein
MFEMTRMCAAFRIYRGSRRMRCVKIGGVVVWGRGGWNRLKCRVSDASQRALSFAKNSVLLCFLVTQSEKHINPFFFTKNMEGKPGISERPPSTHGPHYFFRKSVRVTHVL